MTQLPKDREKLVTDNLNMVHFVLKRKLYVPLGHRDYEDYYQQGCLGLIKAAMRFDETKGFQFSTYAMSIIYGEIRGYRRDNTLVKSPRSLKDLLYRVIRNQALGYTAEEIAELEGVSLSDIQDALNVYSVGSLNEPLSNDEETAVSRLDMIPSTDDGIEQLLSEESIYSAIESVKLLAKSQVQKDIWEEYIYGLLFGEKFGQTYFAKKYGVSQAHVYRIMRPLKEEFERLLTE